jgi:8-oxo-dGTP diphosphatase
MKGVEDIYGGVTVTVARGSFDAVADFEKVLDVSLAHWVETRRRGIWVTVFDAVLIDALCKRGFEMHHVNNDKSLTLTRWLEASPSQLPGHTTHLVGVGGLVIHSDQRRILAISEKYESKMRWKLPGGLLDSGELIMQGVAREVLEETGVKVKPRGVLMMRERTDALFGASDLYVVVVCDALSEEITVDELEISAAQWTLPQELVNDPAVHPFNRGIFELATRITFSSSSCSSLLKFEPFTAFNGNTHVCMTSDTELEIMKKRLS